MTLETIATVSLTVQLFGGSVALSGWPVVAALVAVAWVGELVTQARIARADR